MDFIQRFGAKCGQMREGDQVLDISVDVHGGRQIWKSQTWQATRAVAVITKQGRRRARGQAGAGAGGLAGD